LRLLAGEHQPIEVGEPIFRVEQGSKDKLALLAYQAEQPTTPSPCLS
jgi:hypothetical protein